MIRRPPRSTLFPSTTLFRSARSPNHSARADSPARPSDAACPADPASGAGSADTSPPPDADPPRDDAARRGRELVGDRKSTRLNSSHSQISYAVFCLKNKTNRYRASPGAGAHHHRPLIIRAPPFLSTAGPGLAAHAPPLFRRQPVLRRHGVSQLAVVH